MLILAIEKKSSENCNCSRYSIMCPWTSIAMQFVRLFGYVIIAIGVIFSLVFPFLLT